jgi:hypothetical protein
MENVMSDTLTHGIITLDGSYKVRLTVVDAAKYAETHDGERPTWRSKTVERWLNSTDELDDLFARWRAMGIRAELGRYIGR